VKIKHRFGKMVIACLLLANFESASAGEPADLISLLHSVLGNNPLVLAAQAKLKAAEARKKAADSPLYNPNLDLDYEDASEVTKTLGLSQSIDWGNKRAARTRVAVLQYERAIAQLRSVRQSLALELLNALASYHTAGDLRSIAEQRRNLMKRFLSLTEQRHRAGDLGQVELDLARLAYTEALLRTARLTGLQAQAEQGLLAIAEAGQYQWPLLPKIPAASELDSKNPDVLLEALPSLRVIRFQLAIMQARVNVRQGEQRADPTIGLRGGREASDTLVGLSFSIPLFVRNSFSAEVDAANADAIQIEQRVRDSTRRSRARLLSASRRFDLSRAAWDDWMQIGQTSLERQVQLLERLWSAGELSTTDYLVQLKQTLDTRTAAAELRGSLWQAWFEWLAASGKTEYWLGFKGTS